jgi:membrane peptidoglycan carboxypeptidase
LPVRSFSPPRILVAFAIVPLFVLPLVFAGGTTLIRYYNKATAGLLPPEQVIAQNGGGARILDRNGKLLYQFLDDTRGYTEWASLDDMSPYIKEATIAVEDPDFYSNPGVSIRGLIRAAWENLRPGHDLMQGTGGSSITQQLAKQLYFTQEERSDRSISRKTREIAIAVDLTQHYSKDQILEWYLNIIPYGSVFVGIQEASQRYFSVPASDLTLAQAAFLAGLPQSPSRYDPNTQFTAAKERQIEVLTLMVEHGFLSQYEADCAVFTDLEFKPSTLPFEAPQFVQYVADYIRSTLGQDALLHKGLVVTTSLDLDLNYKAQALLEQHLSANEKNTNAHNGSVIVIDPKTGQLLAMVGSRNYYRDDIDGEVNNALAIRSPGSALKPFTYLTAFLEGWGPDWPIIDTPITYVEDDGKTFSPTNPSNGQTYGVIPAKLALGNSLNVSAFKTILWTGVDNMVRTAKAMGITTLDDQQVGPAVTLGGGDVKLLDLTYAYSVFADNGTMAGAPTTLDLPDGNRKLDPICVLTAVDASGNILIDNTVPQTQEVIKPAYAYMISDILSNDANRTLTFGSGSILNIPGWQAAVKSGTSEPFENVSSADAAMHYTDDTWSVGYTTDTAVGVWIGNSDGSRMQHMYSTTIAAPLWHDVMLAALAGKTPTKFVQPDGLMQATVCVPSGLPVKDGTKCPSVTGTFAADALFIQSVEHWGGEKLDGLVSASTCPTCIPAQIQGWKRYLANEYLGRYKGPNNPSSRTTVTNNNAPTDRTTNMTANSASPAPVPTPIPQQAVTPNTAPQQQPWQAVPTQTPVPQPPTPVPQPTKMSFPPIGGRNH